MAHIARGRADQARDGVLFHILGHVESDHSVFIAEHRLGQRLAQFRLADARGAEKQERANRALRILQTDTAAADGLGHGGDGLVLPHDTLMQRLLQTEHPHALVLGQARDGNTRPAGHDLGDVLGAHTAAVRRKALAPVLALDVHLLGVLLLEIAQLRGLLVVLRGDGVRLLAVQGVDLLLQALEVG